MEGTENIVVHIASTNMCTTGAQLEETINSLLTKQRQEFIHNGKSEEITNSKEKWATTSLKKIIEIIKIMKNKKAVGLETVFYTLLSTEQRNWWEWFNRCLRG